MNKTKVLLSVATALSLSCVLGAQIRQQAYVKASNTDANDHFGKTVALSGNTMVVGAPWEDSNVTGVNGDQTNNSALASGAAYVFVRSGSAWSQQAYLKASNTDAYDWFGSSVAISGDTIVVGAPHERSYAKGINGNQGNHGTASAGAAYVFVRSGTTWTQQAYLKASNTGLHDDFGSCVTVFGDTIVVGAEGESSRSTGVNGSQSNAGLPASGAVYVFVRSGTTWSQQAYVKASNTGLWDRFGSKLSLWGDTLVVGAWAEDSDARGVNGSQGDNNRDSGAAYVFVRSGATWTQQAYLKASNTDSLDYFGWSVAVSQDLVVVGALEEASKTTGVNGDAGDNSVFAAGAAYVFERSGTTWSGPTYLKASNTDRGDRFGGALAVSNGVILVGSVWEESKATGYNGDQGDNSLCCAGAVYVFARTGGAWRQRNYLKASNTGRSDFFSAAIAMSGDTAVIGADWEGSNAQGVNGNQSNNSAVGAGAAYVYTNPQTAHAGYWTYGSGCSSGIIDPTLFCLDVPGLGTAFTIRVRPLTRGMPGVLLFGFSDKFWNGIPLPLDLSFLGMNGCKLLASWDLQVGFAAPASGVWDLTLGVPANAALQGLTFYNQAWVLDSKANAFGVGTSNGGKGVIGY